uniref:Uncharacterized protein n=1 Tax=Anguilla anguilla TaxID=7936 RepID=A0A0E9RUU7_ANGAN
MAVALNKCRLAFQRENANKLNDIPAKTDPRLRAFVPQQKVVFFWKEFSCISNRDRSGLGTGGLLRV